ncbi:MAG: hypothetical protein WB988_21395 [Candidatus Nitrosopolaris sp.]|jgi:hypothetical protein
MSNGDRFIMLGKGNLTYQSVAKYVERQMRQTGHTYALTNKDAILDRLGNYTTPGFAK